MTTTELFVGLKVPDNVAISAFHAIKRMNFKELNKIERQEYYKFEFSGDKSNFEKKIGQVDLLVNANKHKFGFDLRNNIDGISILVQNLGKDSGLSTILKKRLGFKGIKKIEKGIVWTMYFDGNVDAENIAVNIAKSLLMNENYQKYRILE